MKEMRFVSKVLSVFLLVLFVTFIGVKVKGYTLVPYTDTNGNFLTYIRSTTNVMIPDSYEQQDTYLRGIWVTPKDGSNIGNIKTTNGRTKEQAIKDYKAEVIQIFDVMEYYNLNALIFHIRVDNDAIYYSDMNPWSDWFTTYGVDPGWDPLEFVIDECHKRGYEFHAWMNPYRIKAASNYTIGELSDMIRRACPKNIGANVEYLLGEPDGGAILNPGIPEVRKFIVDTCMEVIEKYDVDAIHFDDYFYSDLGANGALSGSNSILKEADQVTYEKYKGSKYNLNSATDKANWRREQVDTFIHDLSIAMRAYNESHNRHVQLGISPSGVWKSGDGKVTYNENGDAITNGSTTTTTFEHYGVYLFSDTLKWINEEWIDYIMPQMYWGFTHPSAGFADLCDWWSKVVKYKNVLLYSGMGIYMAETPGSNYSWGKDYEEAYNQILYVTKLKTVSGTVFYNYGYLKKAYLGDNSSLFGRGMKLVKEKEFTIPAILPEIKSMDPVKLNDVTSLEVINNGSDNTITFDKVDGAKQYIIYRDSKPMEFKASQVVKIIGPNDVNGKISYVDKNAGDEKYVYGVRVLSRTNTLSDGVDFGMLSFKVTFKDESGNTLSTTNVSYGNKAVEPIPPTKAGATFVGWSMDISSVKEDMIVTPKYTDSTFKVDFYDMNNQLIKSENVEYKGSATAPDPTKEGYTFISWDKPFNNVIYDLKVYGNYKVNIYKVKFIDWDNKVISEVDCEYNAKPQVPENPSRTGYDFIGWDKQIDSIKGDTTFTATYKAKVLIVTLINDLDDSIIGAIEVPYGTDAVLPEAPKIKGYEFSSWRGSYTNVISDRNVRAIYNIGVYQVIFKDWDGTILSTQEIIYEDVVSEVKIPERIGYIFDGWDTDYSDVCSDLVVTATYKPITFTVKFYGPDNELIHEETVEYGSNCDYEANINNYTFKSWDKDLTNITSDLEVHGTFEIIPVENGCKKITAADIISIFSLCLLFGLIRKKKFQ